MTEKEQEAYAKGEKAVWLRMLREAAGHLSLSEQPFSTERADVVALLRALCSEYGDNDWPDDLHLSDVIEKHLIRHLDL